MSPSNSFKHLLKTAGITKAELSRQLGITADAVSRWGDSPPRYATAYLELLIEINGLRWLAKK